MHPSNSVLFAEATELELKSKNVIKSSYYPVPLNPLNLKVNKYCHPVHHPPENKLLVIEQSKIRKYNKRPKKPSRVSNLKLVSIHAKTITRVRNVYCNEPPYSLAATEVFAKLHLLLATSCLLGRYHKTTQAG